ncbi:four helix bundle protein [Candidatus Parcubacteria bacterium]|nr:four helix bundle protein [Candidatus Parcubacteria bacterium]
MGFKTHPNKKCEKAMLNSKQLPLYHKSYLLIKYFYRLVKNFPKHYKYTLGQSMIDLSWQCLDLVLAANVLPNKDKYYKILELSAVFDKLKLRIRMTQEIGLISSKQFAHLQVNYIAAIGEMIGGWLKWALNCRGVVIADL